MVYLYRTRHLSCTSFLAKTLSNHVALAAVVSSAIAHRNGSPSLVAMTLQYNGVLYGVSCGLCNISCREFFLVCDVSAIYKTLYERYDEMIT